MFKRTVSLPIGSRSFFLFGARQTGKSTLIREKLAGIRSLTLDFLARDVFLKYKSHPEMLRHEVDAMDLTREPLTIFMDEIQKVPEILDEVHLLIEKYKGRLSFIMTGSSARKLKRTSANLLAGRAWQYFLHPLTHVELGSDFSLSKALSRGTLPPIIFETEDGVTRTLQTYAQTYLKEEILDEALTRNVTAFSKFLEIAADQSGQILNYSGMARETHVASKTIQSYYQILEDTLIAFRLPPYERSARKRLVLHPKYYFFDLGVMQSLTGRIGQEVREGTGLYGKLFEHFIVSEIMRLVSYQNKPWHFYHWRTTTGAEVDLVVETPEKLWAIEIKTSPRVEASDLKGLASFAECFPKARCVCVGTPERAYKAGAFYVIPWRDLFNADYLGLSALQL